MIINIVPRQIAKLFISIIICLTLIHCILQFVEFSLGFSKIHLIRVLFDFERDSNITTWYSSITLFISFILLTLIAIAKKRVSDTFAFQWQFLAIIFAFLSLDEIAMLHERSGEVLKILVPIEFDGFLYFQWVLIGIPVTLIIALIYLKFILHLPAKTRNLIIFAGALFVGGALGLEILAGHRESLNTSGEFFYKLITTIEESWEKLGVMVFIYALLDYMQKYVNHIQIIIGNNSSLNQADLSQIREEYPSK